MNDPWDVKSVRRAGQYVSCMKINGVPLLPPILSKECREEMHYYKLLAKQVEKRVSHIVSLINCNSEIDEKTDTSQQPETDVSDEQTAEDQQGVKLNVLKVIDLKSPRKSPHVSTNGSSITSNLTTDKKSHDSSDSTSPPKLIVDFRVDINKIKNKSAEKPKAPLQSLPVDDLPERDYDCLLKPKQKLQNNNIKKQDKNDKVVNKTKPNLKILPLYSDGPSSISAKSFTGSLNDIFTECLRESQTKPKLTRQRSYTVLQPCPHLLAHLENESYNTGVAVTSISMSDSLYNLTSSNKKRRSWDLETAKVKWSSMAMELKQTQIGRCLKVNGATKRNMDQTVVKKVLQNPNGSQQRNRSLSPVLPKHKYTVPEKFTPKSDPVQKPRQRSPARNSTLKTKETVSPKPVYQTKKTPEPVRTSSESEDPAVKVRELYEKIQRQQLMQMASLVDKQKKEQMLLQQVFEEQNNMLYKQLKTICPKSPVEVKEAWGEMESPNRGPVSLSQLINHKTPEKSSASPLSTTLAKTNNYIDHADDVLKKSRNISNSLKKQELKSQKSSEIKSPSSPVDGSRTRTHSPVYRNITSRKLNYDTSVSSDRDYEPILTDRTNDTMADLNVTFPSDSDDVRFCNDPSQLCNNDLTVIQRNMANPSMRSTDSAIRCLEQTIINSINSAHSTPQLDIQFTGNQPSPKELRASSIIVAYAKGYLVRRLLKTERVQGTVQTIRDALLCALQLHQDRQGIRGADVDLHRRLIQQITAACYTLHDTFITSTCAERCSMIAADRVRQRMIAAKATPPKPFRKTNVMSHSHSGSFPTRSKRTSGSPCSMTQSSYETYSTTPQSSRVPWR